MEDPSKPPLLPPELQRLIVLWADQPTLKQCRLVNRAFRQTATGQLFRQLHIARHLTTLRCAVKITRNKELAACVKELVFHYGVVSPDFRTEHDFKNRVTWLREGYDVPLLSSRDIARLYHRYIQFLTDQVQFDHHIITSQLHDLLPLLPNLDTIDCRNPVPATYNPNGFTELLTGLPLEQSDGWLTITDRICFPTFRQPKLMSFSAVDLNMQVSRSLLAQLRSRLSDVHEFKFHFYPPKGAWHLHVWEPMFCCHWPSLRRLDIAGVVALQSHLVEFLSNHALTLRHLRVGNLQLQGGLPQAHSGGCRAQILSLFYQLQSSLQLRTVELAGSFLSSRGRGWSAYNRYYGGLPCYLTQLEDYICHRRPLPPQSLDQHAVLDIGHMCKVSHDQLLDVTARSHLDSDQTESASQSQQGHELQLIGLQDQSWTLANS